MSGVIQSVARTRIRSCRGAPTLCLIAPHSDVYYDSNNAMSETARAFLRNNPVSSAESSSSPEGEPGFLWDFWYPALRSTQIRGEKLATATLLEVPLVLGRTSDGKSFAMRDSCPHRGIPLSHGEFDGKVVECSYHGWRFEACT